MVPKKKSLRRRVVMVSVVVVAMALFAIFLFRDGSAQAGSDPDQMSEMERRIEERRKAAKARKAKRQALIEQREKEREQQRQEDLKRYEEERAKQLARLEAARVESKSKPRKRKIRRFTWEEIAAARGRIWNVPREETEESLLTAFLRVCMAEASGNTQDCVGIWQVVSGNRRRNCVNARGIVRRITECDAETDIETMLSSFRRHQRHVMGYMPKRNRRAVWIANLETDCEMPKGWIHSQDRWDAEYGARICPQIVADGRYLIKGELPPPRPGHRAKWISGRPIAWGGRCESKTGACDDPDACAQGYARIKTDTLNAFWCRIGGRGCRKDPDPVCVELGKMPQNRYILTEDGYPVSWAASKRLPSKVSQKAL